MDIAELVIVRFKKSIKNFIEIIQTSIVILILKLISYELEVMENIFVSLKFWTKRELL